MWKPLIRCSIVGGIIVYLWFMISWMILPLHKMSMNTFSNPSEVTSCILRSAPKDGIYVIPKWDQDQEKEKRASEPLIFVNVVRVADKNMTRSMVIGLITDLIGAFLITYLLLRAKAMKYWRRVGFVTVVESAIAFLGTVPAWNWWQFPMAWSILECFDIVIAWFLGGLVIAKLAKN